MQGLLCGHFYVLSEHIIQTAKTIFTLRGQRRISYPQPAQEKMCAIDLVGVCPALRAQYVWR